MCNYEKLTDQDLLSMIVMESTGGIAENLIKEFKSLYDVVVDSEEVELLRIKGLGEKKVKQLKAVAELSRRIYEVDLRNIKGKISNPSDVSVLLMNEMKFLKKEHLKVLLLDTKNQVIDIETVSIGSLNSSIVHPREVFNIAIRKLAASIVVVHNHPSGDTKPSKEDISITKRLIDSGEILGIKLLDHIIIGMNKYCSLKEEGLI